MAKRASKVYGVEIVQDAVDAARMNAELNGIANCEFICGDVKEKLSELEERPDVIVVDPPRVGMHDKVVDMLSAYGIPEILYVSCNPKTMSMNLERFKVHGYEPVVIKAYDNFPMTKYVEYRSVLVDSRVGINQTTESIQKAFSSNSHGWGIRIFRPRRDGRIL